MHCGDVCANSKHRSDDDRILRHVNPVQGPRIRCLESFDFRELLRRHHQGH